MAGAAAVLSGTNPRLPPQVQEALTASASPMQADGTRLGSWQVGYGPRQPRPRRRPEDHAGPPTPGTAANLASSTATVCNSRGTIAGETTTSTGYALDVAGTLVRDLAPGRYTIEVTGDCAASDPDTNDSDSVNGRAVFLQAAQLRSR